ncbi:MAG TPA: hypothetical protein VE178_04175 [Silvibacterium sp.]|jgi:hypothetical protein|nr:hypothetical protein [Silvibacterium sp.]
MASNSWIDGNAHLPSSPARFDLRPLSTGEVLDRTFQLYRSRFALFAGLAVLPAGVSVVTQSVRLWYSAHQSLQVHTGSNVVKVQVITVSLTFVSLVISLLLYGITQAATTWAVSAVYLGEPATIHTAYQTALKHWVRYTLIVLRQIWAGFWLPLALVTGVIAIPLLWRGSRTANVAAAVLIFLTFCSLGYALWAYIRVSLAVPAAVMESLKVRASIRRSKQLLVSRKVRVLLLLIFLFALYLVIGTIQTPLAVFALRMRGTQAFVTHAISLAIGFLTGTLIGPISAIAVCLFYIDERVRREGFDIEWMMTKIAPVQTPALNEPRVAPPPTQENSAGL